MSDSLAIRTARNSDRSAIEQLVFGVLIEYGLGPEPHGVDTDLHDIERNYAGGLFDVLIDSKGEIVGTIGLYRCSQNQCELRKMYLAQPVRGKGWGRRLLEHALAKSRELGFSRVTLETATVLREAVRLYESYGFKPYKPDHCAKRCDAAYYLDL
jgi:putative acetyltransferase